MQKTLSPSEEEKLLTAVKSAVDLVDNQGMSPNDALIKVAQDQQLAPGFVRAAVSAYNNGRQVAQFNASDGILDKLADFPLADYDTIHSAVWGGSEKEALDRYAAPEKISEDYLIEPYFIRDEAQEKLARYDISQLTGKTEHEPSELQRQFEREKQASQAWSARAAAKRRAEECRTKYAAAQDKLRINLASLENYFKKIAMDRMPFSVVDDAVQTYFGTNGRSLMNLIASKLPNEKRASETRIFWDRPINLKAEPFSFVEPCIKAATAVNHAQAELQQAWEDVKTAGEALLPFAQPLQGQQNQEITPSLIEEPQEKVAFLGLAGASAIGATTKSLLDKALDPTERNNKTQQTYLDLGDPEHENELRQIENETMLAGMLSDPENPISGYDPEEVLSAYNEIQQMAPQSASQPAVIQSLLAKRLAGNMEPFEVKEISDLEKGLKDSKPQYNPSANIMSNANRFNLN